VYRDVSTEYVRDEPIKPASLGCEQHPHGERLPDALPLPFIADHQSNLCRVVIDRCKAAKRRDFGPFGNVQLCEHCQTPPIIDAAAEFQNGIGQPRRRRKESEVARPRTQMTVEFANRTVVAGTQRADVKSRLFGSRM